MRIVAYEGKHKMADKWEDNPYVILAQVNHGIPVYKVMREDGEGRCRVLHRNLLLPIGSKFPKIASTAQTIEKKEGRREIG